MLALRRRVAAPDGTAARQGNEAILHSMLLAGVGTSRPQKLQRRLHKLDGVFNVMEQADAAGGNGCKKMWYTL